MGLLPFRGAASQTLRAGDKKGNTTLMSKRFTITRKHLFLLGISAILLLVMACAPDAKQSTFGTSGPVAEQQLLLFNVLLWVMVIVFIMVEGVLLYAVIKFRRRPGQNELPPQTHGHTALEITWTVVPTILILALGIWSAITLFELDQPPSGADALEVTVVGHQWWWEFEYPDADGNGKYITTANELRVPVDRAVWVNLRSDDVIHSFWIPKLAGKIDMVPTRENYLWFQADETGTYYGQCAEFCGTAHAQMKFLVQVLPQEDYFRVGRELWRSADLVGPGPGRPNGVQWYGWLRCVPHRHGFGPAGRSCQPGPELYDYRNRDCPGSQSHRPGYPGTVRRRSGGHEPAEPAPVAEESRGR